MLSARKQSVTEIEKLQSKLKKARYQLEEPIAVIGIGCQFPGNVNTLERFWQELQQGDGIRFSDPKQQKSIQSSTIVDGYVVDAPGASMLMDTDFFNITEEERKILDDQHYLLMESCWQACESAGIVPESLQGSLSSVFINVDPLDDTENNHLDDRRGEQEKVSSVIRRGLFSSRVAHMFGLEGATYVMDSVNSSSLTTIHLACQELRQQLTDLAFVGAVSSSKEKIFSEDKLAKSPANLINTDVTEPNIACVVIILRRLSEAVKENNPILAIIKGSTINNSAAYSKLLTPSSEAQKQLMQKALDETQLQPTDIGYVEVIGESRATETAILKSISELYGGTFTAENPLNVGFLPESIAKYQAVSGLAAVIKGVQILKHKYTPSNGKARSTLPIQDLAKSINVVSQTAAWKGGVNITHMAISSSGLTGNNCHLIIEQSPSVQMRVPNDGEELLHVLALSAKTATALQDTIYAYQQKIEQHPDWSLKDICYTSNCGRSHFDYRFAIVTSNQKQLCQRLLSTDLTQSSSIFSGFKRSNQKLSFFLGNELPINIEQGLTLYHENAEFQQIINECDNLLRNYIDKPLLSLLWGEDAKFIQNIRYAIPALFVFQYSLVKLWQKIIDVPFTFYVQGVGEYVAASATGIMTLDEALKLVSSSSRYLGYSDKQNAPTVSYASSKQQLILHFTDQLSSVQLQQTTTDIISHATGQRINEQLITPAYWLEQINQLGAVSNTDYKLNNELGISTCIIISADIGVVINQLTSVNSHGHVDYLYGWDNVKQSSMLPAVTLAKLHCLGLPINWQYLEPSEQGHILPLPSYPFQRNHTLNQLVGSVKPMVANKGLLQNGHGQSTGELSRIVSDNYIYQQIWQTAHSVANDPNLAQQTWLVFVDKFFVGERLARQIEQLGANCIRVYEAAKNKIQHNYYLIDPNDEGSYQFLFQSIKNKEINGVIFGWSLMANLNTDSIRLQQMEMLLNYLNQITKMLLTDSAKSALRLIMLTNGVYRITGEEEALAPEQSVVNGFYEAVISKKKTKCQYVHLDLDNIMVFDEQKVLFACLNSDQHQLAFRDNQVFYPQLVNQSQIKKSPIKTHSHSSINIQSDKSYLITHAEQPLALKIAGWLIEQGAKYLIFSTESVVERAGEFQQMKTLWEQQQVSIVIKKINLSDKNELSSLITEAGENKPLAGIIYVENKIAKEKSSNFSFARLTLPPSVDHICHLYSAIQGLSLDFLIMCANTSRSQNDDPANAFSRAFMHAMTDYCLDKSAPVSVVDCISLEEDESSSLNPQHAKPNDRVITTDDLPIMHALASVLKQNHSNLIVCQSRQPISHLSSTTTDLTSMFSDATRTKSARAELLYALSQVNASEQLNVIIQYLESVLNKLNINLDKLKPGAIYQPIKRYGLTKETAQVLWQDLSAAINLPLPLSLALEEYSLFVLAEELLVLIITSGLLNNVSIKLKEHAISKDEKITEMPTEFIQPTVSASKIEQPNESISDTTQVEPVKEQISAQHHLEQTPETKVDSSRVSMDTEVVFTADDHTKAVPESASSAVRQTSQIINEERGNSSHNTNTNLLMTESLITAETQVGEITNVETTQSTVDNSSQIEQEENKKKTIEDNKEVIKQESSKCELERLDENKPTSPSIVPEQQEVQNNSTLNKVISDMAGASPAMSANAITTNITDEELLPEEPPVQTQLSSEPIEKNEIPGRQTDSEMAVTAAVEINNAGNLSANLMSVEQLVKVKEADELTDPPADIFTENKIDVSAAKKEEQLEQKEINNERVVDPGLTDAQSSIQTDKKVEIQPTTQLMAGMVAQSLSVEKETKTKVPHDEIKAAMVTAPVQSTEPQKITADKSSIDSVDRPLHLLAMSATEPDKLYRQAEKYLEYIKSQQNQRTTLNIADICFSANFSRNYFDYRTALIVSTLEDLIKQLGQVTQLSLSPIKQSNKLVWLFSNEEQLTSNTGKLLYQTQPIFRHHVDECAAILNNFLDVPLTDVLWGDSDELLKYYCYALPALFALQYALGRLWMSWGIEPDAIMGYGRGEFAAACLSGVFSVFDGIKLSVASGRLMDQYQIKGDLIRVSEDENTLSPLLDGLKIVLTAYSDHESTLFGSISEVNKFVQRAHSTGIMLQRIPEQVRLQNCQDEIEQNLRFIVEEITYHQPKYAYFSAVLGQKVQREVTNADYWIEQFLTNGDRYEQAINCIRALNMSCYLELGPGDSLIDISDQRPDEIWINCLANDVNEWDSLLTAVKELYIVGLNPDWQLFDKPYSRTRLSLPIQAVPLRTQQLKVEVPIDNTLDSLNGLKENIPQATKALEATVEVKPGIKYVDISKVPSEPEQNGANLDINEIAGSEQTLLLRAQARKDKVIQYWKKYVHYQLSRIENPKTIAELYQLEWQPELKRSDCVAAIIFPPVQYIRTIYQERIADKIEIAQYNESSRVMEILHKMSKVAVSNMFSKLGYPLVVGNEISIDGLLQVCPTLLPQYYPSLRAFMRLFLEQGNISPTDNGWLVRQTLPESDLEPYIEQLKSSYKYFNKLITLYQRCLENLPAILTGKQNIDNLLLPNGKVDELRAIYDEMPQLKKMNQIVAQLIKQIVSMLPAGRTLRILEVGGGTGSTTMQIVKHLSADCCQYLFTDKSPVFLEQAKQYLKDYSFIDYQQLDIEQLFEIQQIELSSFDIIIAVNVLYATKELEYSIEHLRQLLVPGGYLLVAELTEPHGYFDLTVGLSADWWNFTDKQIRYDYPLIKASEWQKIFDRSEYEQAMIINRDSEPKEMVLLSRNKLSLDAVNFSVQQRFLQGLINITVDTQPLLDKIQKEQVYSELNRISANAIAYAFNQLGFSFVNGIAISSEQLMSYLMIKKDYREAMNRWLNILAEYHFVTPTNQYWRVLRELPTVSPLTELGTLRKSYPDYTALFDILQKRFEQLAEMMRGKIEPLEVPPIDELQIMKGFYRETPNIYLMNNQIKEIIHNILQIQPTEPLRILEVGAGTGSIAATILPILANQPVKYYFTDIETDYLVLASQEFADYPFVEYRLFDINHAPAEQNLLEEQFDIIIADHALCMAKDLGLSLQYIRRLLKPGGYLILEEFTSPQSWIDLIFGFSPSWWNFKDKTLRPSYPLLSLLGWKELSEKVGFSGFTALTQETSPKQAVIVLNNGAPIQQRKHILVFMDKGQEDFIHKLIQLEKHVIRVYPGSCYEHIDTDVYQISPQSQEDCQQLARQLGQIVCEHVVYLWDDRSINNAASDFSLYQKEQIHNIHQIVCGVCTSLKYIIKELIQPYSAQLGPLWVVTRESQSIPAQVALSGFMNAMLWGLVRSLRAEQPKLDCHIVDLSKKATLTDLLLEIMSYESKGLAQPSVRVESEVTFDDKHRYVPKLTINSEPALTKIKINANASYIIVGGLAKLGIETVKWLIEQGAVSLILVDSPGKKSTSVDSLSALQKMAALTIIEGDVTNYQQMQSVLKYCGENMPTIAGVIYVVGNEGKERSSEPTGAESILWQKTIGAWNLHLLTQKLPLDFMIYLSSINNALQGGSMLGEYAAAGAYLDALSVWRRQQNLPALSFNWTVKIPTLKQNKQVESQNAYDLIELPVKLISKWRLFSKIASALNSEKTPLSTVVTIEDINRALLGREHQASLEMAGTYVTTSAMQAVDQALSLERVHYLRSLTAIEQHKELQEQIKTDVVAVKPEITIRDIGPEASILELLVEPELIEQLHERLQLRFGCSLPITILFNYSIITSLADYLISLLNLAQPQYLTKTRQLSINEMSELLKE